MSMRSAVFRPRPGCARWVSLMSLRLNRPLEDILYMPIGQEVVIRRGQRPIITRRYDIQKNELYQEITEEYNRQLKAAEKEQIEIYQY